MSTEEDRAPLLHHLRLGLLGTALGLSVAACGNVGVSNGTATVTNSSSGAGVATASGTATLNWDATTLNTDGTALTDLAGYKVFYGLSASSMDAVVELSDPSLTTYVVSNLSSGTWYFGVSAYTNIGTESAMSNVATKTFN